MRPGAEAAEVPTVRAKVKDKVGARVDGHRQLSQNQCTATHPREAELQPQHAGEDQPNTEPVQQS